MDNIGNTRHFATPHLDATIALRLTAWTSTPNMAESCELHMFYLLVFPPVLFEPKKPLPLVLFYWAVSRHVVQKGWPFGSGIARELAKSKPKFPNGGPARSWLQTGSFPSTLVRWVQSWCPIHRGVGQGCVLSPRLFCSALEAISARCVWEWNGSILENGGERLVDLRFADDIPLLGLHHHNKRHTW